MFSEQLVTNCTTERSANLSILFGARHGISSGRSDAAIGATDQKPAKKCADKHRDRPQSIKVTFTEL